MDTIKHILIYLACFSFILCPHKTIAIEIGFSCNLAIESDCTDYGEKNILIDFSYIHNNK